MGRPVALAALIVAVVTCLLAVVLAFTPLLDGRALGPTMGSTDALADQVHHGPRPCLRYDTPSPSKSDVALYGKQFVGAGISSHRLAELVYEFQARKETREAAAHARDEADERLDWAAQTGPVTRLLVALKRPRLRKVLHRYLDRAVSTRPVAPLTAHEREVLDQAWESSPRLLMLDGVLALIKVMRVLETQKKLDALAAFVTDRGELDERALPSDLLDDAWGGPVKINTVGNEVQFSSLGADAMLGGTDDDSDLTSTATVSRAPQGVAAPEAQPDLAIPTGAPPPASVTVLRSDFDQALEHLNELATQARIVPSFEGGKAVGFKVYGIHKGSLYQRLGLESGDVVTRINGLPLDSPDKALEVYSKLRDSREVTLSLSRSGKPYQLRIDLK